MKSSNELIENFHIHKNTECDYCKKTGLYLLCLRDNNHVCQECVKLLFTIFQLSQTVNDPDLTIISGPHFDLSEK